MTFDGFDIAPLIEGGSFTSEMIAAPEPEAATLDAALHEAARAERAAIRAEATMLDLWLDRPGGANLSALERPGLGAQTSWHAWAALAEDSAILDLSVGKDSPLFAAFGEDEEEVEIIVIATVERPNEVDENGNIGGGGGFYPGGTPGGGGNGGDTPSQQTEVAEDTPCVDEIPAGVTKDQVNDLAKAAATRLASLQDSTNWEWGAVIYKDASGQLWASAPFTAQQHDNLIGASFRIPAGSVIVGYVHTHPTDATMDERTLSGEDRQFISSLIARTGSVTADPNMLAYVTTKDGSSTTTYDSYSTYVYDKSERNRTSPGCDL